MRLLGRFAFLLLAAGCAHKPLSGRALDEIHRPAFIARIEDDAGPKAYVFRSDSSYGEKLKKLSAKEADRRLAAKLAGGSEDAEGNKQLTINRFQVGDTLRSHTLSKLPKEAPWTNTARPGDVAASLQSFLVEEVPANAPDYDLLKPLGVDAVIEFVVEEYGMRSEDGRAGCFVVGYGRMFMLEGGGNIWYRSFRADQVESKQPHLDPFKVAKDTSLFRSEMSNLLKAVAEVFAQDLNPPERRASKSLKEGSDESPDSNKPGSNKPASIKPGSSTTKSEDEDPL